MTYQHALEYIYEHSNELIYDASENIEYILFIAPTNSDHFEIFKRQLVLSNFDPDVALGYSNEDVCVIKVVKKGLAQGAFVFGVVVT